MANNGRSSLRSSLSEIQDPIDFELTEVAKEAFAPIGKNGSCEQLNDESSSVFLYGAADGDDHPQTHNEESMSLSDRFNEENVIDILANVDSDAINSEHMVTHQEDSLAKTIAGVAGNVLEW